MIPIHVINNYWITSIKDEAFGESQIINSKSFLDELAKRRKDGNETIVELQFTLRTSSSAPSDKKDYSIKNNNKIKTTRVYKSFEQRIEDLRLYKEKHGHVNVKEREDKSLYKFCKNIRYTRKYPGKPLQLKLDDDRIAKLDTLGFDWSVNERRTGKKSLKSQRLPAFPPDHQSFGQRTAEPANASGALQLRPSQPLTTSSSQDMGTELTSSPKPTKSKIPEGRIPKGRRPKSKSPKQIAAWEKRIEHHYHDHAAVPTIDQSKVKHKAKGGVVVQFPVKLHAMLDKIEADGLAHVVSWQPHGRCFVVHKPKEFVHDVMPHYFKQTKMTSFQRQLNLYGFNRMTGGLDKGGYYHELFLRGKVGLAYDIQRKRVKGTGFRLPTDPDNVPNFYALPPTIKDAAAPHLRAAVTALKPDPVARKKLQDEVTMMSKQDIISTNTSSRCKALSPTKVKAAAKMSKSEINFLRSRPQISRGHGQPVHSPHPHDVLSGRGGIVNSHPGNVNFRKIVDSNKREYLDPRIKRTEKTLITKRIVANVRSLEPNGRFLAKDLRLGCWIEIGDEKAWMKAGQALWYVGVHEGKKSDDDEIEDRSTTEEPPTKKNRGVAPPESKE